LGVAAAALCIAAAVELCVPAAANARESEGIRSFYATDTLKKARKAWQKGDHAKALKLFEKAAVAETDAQALYRVRFLQARVRFDAGAWEDAAARFEAVAAEADELQDWSWYYAGRARAENGQPSVAAEDFARVAAGSALHDEALLAQCTAYDSAGDLECVTECAESYRTLYEPVASLLLLEGRALLQLKRTDEGVAVLHAILVRFPAQEEAEAASGVLKKLEKRGVPAASQLSVEETLQQASSLIRRFRHTKALEIALAVAKAQQQGTDAWCRATELAARSEAGRREETRSLPHFEKLFEKCGGQLSPEVLYLGAESARKASRDKLARAWTDRLVETFPTSSLCDDALVGVARLHDSRGEREEVAKVVERTLAAYPAGDMASEAAWLSVYDRYRNGEYQEAFDLASRYQVVLPAREDYRTNGRLLYWMGRCKQMLKKPKEAVPYFVQVVEQYPLEWYALLSYLRLEEHKAKLGARTLQGARRKSKPVLPGASEVLGALDLPGHAGTARLFLSMGLTEEARRELDALAHSGAVGTAQRSLLLAAFLMNAAGMYSPSHHTLRNKVSVFAFAYPLASDDRWWKTAYPDAFSGPARRSAAAEKIPWPLVQGVIREESGFSPTIESYAHAIGLMQLLEKTASQMAGRKMTAAELKDPSVNVPLGTKYLRFLWDRFGHPVLVVAGYNSGPGGVAKALARTRTRQIDEFVESIPFDQTRRYTKRVLGSAWTYQYLYGPRGDKLFPFPLEFPEQKKK